MVRTDRPYDIESLMKLAKACAEHLRSCGIYQWNDQYPNLGVFERDIARNELYVLEYKQEIIGSNCISAVMNDICHDVEWITSNQDNLAIYPTYQRMGNAQFLMDFTKEMARQNEYQSVRLNTFSKNLRNQNFYELRGYKKLGNI